MLRLFGSTTIRTVALLITLAIGWSAYAVAMESVQFPPPPKTPVITVIDGSRKVQVDLAQIEGLGLYRITTTSPWEPGKFTYEGVLMRDVIRMIGLADKASIRVSA